MKRRAEETVEATSQVINESITGLSQAAQGCLPNFGALRKTVRRRRNEISAAPQAPADLESLVFPEAYKIYKPLPDVEERFLLADSGPGHDRIVIFGRQSSLQVLQESKCWYGDGTFKPAPPLFAQIYTVLAERYGGVHPVVYALLPNKQQATYSRFFQMLNTICPDLAPDSISCDFEVGAFRAMQERFPDAQIFGCFFHLCHNMKKQVGNLQLMQQYNNNANFALSARMVTALAFVPPRDLDDAIDSLGAFLPNDLQPLLEWFEDYYVGRMNRRGHGRRPGLFPIEMWTLYDRVLNDQNRTNNHAKAAHRRIQTELGMDHPTIRKLIDDLHKVQKGRDVFYEHLVAGREPPKKLKKYRDDDHNIRNIVTDYANRNVIDYLRGLAHNYEMNS